MSARNCPACGALKHNFRPDGCCFRCKSELTEKVCKTCGKQPSLEVVFSAHPSTADRLQQDCNKCKAAYQKELRNRREAETLMRTEQEYLDRYEQRRYQESIEPVFEPREVTECLEESIPVEEIDVVGFDTSSGGFHSLMKFNPFLHHGKPKPRTPATQLSRT